MIRRTAGWRAAAFGTVWASIGVACAVTAPPNAHQDASAHDTDTDGDRWVPQPVTALQWLLDHPLDLTRESDMGTGALDFRGDPAADPMAYDIDGFDNPASTVAALHAAGKRVICYIETGGWESYRADASDFPPEVRGNTMRHFPDERYLDVRSPIVVELIKARVDMCADKGFDAIEPDIDDSYREDTGFPITFEENLSFNAEIAKHAHRLGLSIGLKNGDDPAFAAAMEPFVDFVLVEQCFEFDTCDSYAPFSSAGKAVFAVEYNLHPAEFCTRANALDFNAARYSVELNGPRRPCR